MTANGTLVFNRSDAITVSNAIGGTGAVVQNGSGTLTLLGANTFTGITTINAGNLNIGNGGTTGSLAGPIVANNGTITVNRSNNSVLSGGITGSPTRSITTARGP